jgi:hypothetical protein
MRLQLEWDLKPRSRVRAVDGIASKVIILALLQLLWFQVKQEAIFSLLLMQITYQHINTGTSHLHEIKIIASASLC